MFQEPVKHIISSRLAMNLFARVTNPYPVTKLNFEPS